MLDTMLSRWSETITINIASAKDQYNQCTYTESTIQGRLIQTEEEILMYKNARQDKNMGEKVIAKAKLFTQSSLNIDDKVGDYKIISKKQCKDRNNNVIFYKYYLK